MHVRKSNPTVGATYASWTRSVHFRTCFLILASLLAALSSYFAEAATPSNAQSPLGINLTAVNYFSSEQPFLNIFKTTGPWLTQTSSTWDTGEEAYLNLDSSGWPKSLVAVNEPTAQKFTAVGVLMLRSLPSTSNGYYPAGQYVVLYDGQGTITYSQDAVKNSSLSAAGRDVINVATPSPSGIYLSITSTDPNHTGNYIRNIRVVKAEEESALDSGQIFSPTFLDIIRNFNALRFMDWLGTNNSTLSSWANRPQLTDATWGGPNGTPIEVAVQAANAVSADAWVNVPAQADNNYITQFATLVHQQLGNTQKVYVEYSNETWNYQFTQASWIQAQGQTEWPNASGSSAFDLNRNWFGQRTAQICDTWKTIWGADASRVICVLGAQAANSYTATEALGCPLWTSGKPCSGHGIGAVAIAPYFGGNVPTSWLSLADGGLTNLFSEITLGGLLSGDSGGYLAQIAAMETSYKAALAPLNLPFIAYEGGQSFEGFPNGLNSDGSNSALTNLYIAANRDPRMGTAYTQYLQQWKANGGQLNMIFADVGAYTQYGEWGMLESSMQSITPLTSAPPKWQAVQNFITEYPCWWSGCTGSSAKIPMAPSSLITVQ